MPSKRKEPKKKKKNKKKQKKKQTKKQTKKQKKTNKTQVKRRSSRYLFFNDKSLFLSQSGVKELPLGPHHPKLIRSSLIVAIDRFTDPLAALLPQLGNVLTDGVWRKGREGGERGERGGREGGERGERRE